MTDTPTLPSIIALCGPPSAGKTTAAHLLAGMFAYVQADDAYPLRDIGMRYFGLTKDQCYTEAGKNESVDIGGRTMTARQVLGEIGSSFEDKFGTEILAVMAHNTMRPGARYIIPSVRGDQGYFWKKMGGVVLEIDRIGSPPPENYFDRYALGAINKTVLNTLPFGQTGTDEDLAAFAESLEKAVLEFSA